MAIDREEMIRERARQIWENEGRPDGEQDRHWSEATSQIEAEERIGATDDLEDTELTSALATQDDPVEDAFLDTGDLQPDLPEEIDAEPPPDLGGRVKNPI
ncbi:DUF2934 domain-containing protein [uncultured Amaricoccus sp.]|uniref:DUF2934 domain-containing protein n=1 Tax=uncultured Amaricoccus sp. TaxID=339341 RepID=UPI00260DA87E|nr:DUF2934 domain-containing protein [uncultured Amaricoccus sp.]